MYQNILPKPVLSAINRNAFRIAKTEAYATIKSNLKRRAHHLMSQAHATSHQVVEILDGNHYVQTSAPGEGDPQ